MIFCFDTSAINQLHDDTDKKTILAGLKAAHRTYITSVNIAEILATKNEDRRRSLLVLASNLAGENDILVFPHDLLQTRMKDYAAGNPRRDIDHLVGEGTFRNFLEIDEKNRDEYLQWKERMDKSFDWFATGRPKLEDVFLKGTERPESLSDLIRNHYSDKTFLHSIVSDLYQKTTGREIEPDNIQPLFEAMPELPIFLLAMANAAYERCMKTEGYGAKGKAGACDLWAAAYMPLYDYFVTFDQDQYKNFRRANVLNSRRTQILLYNRFKERLFIG
jgi:hypothetical protein